MRLLGQKIFESSILIAAAQLLFQTLVMLYISTSNLWKHSLFDNPFRKNAITLHLEQIIPFLKYPLYFAILLVAKLVPLYIGQLSIIHVFLVIYFSHLLSLWFLAIMFIICKFMANIVSQKIVLLLYYNKFCTSLSFIMTLDSNC